MTAALTVHYGHIDVVPIHFDDLDAMGIVHNAKYAVLLERALIKFWAERGHSYENGRTTTTDSFNAVREFRITYHAPIRSTGDVAIHFWVEHIGTSSGVYAFRFTSPDLSTVYAEGRRVNVKLDPKTMRPAPWSDEARAIGMSLLRPAESAGGTEEVA